MLSYCCSLAGTVQGSQGVGLGAPLAMLKHTRVLSTKGLLWARSYSVKGSTFQTFYPKKLKGSTFQAFYSVNSRGLHFRYFTLWKGLHFRHFTLKGSPFCTFYSGYSKGLRCSCWASPYGLDRSGPVWIPLGLGPSIVTSDYQFEVKPKHVQISVYIHIKINYWFLYFIK